MKSHHMETSKSECLVQESSVVGDIHTIHTTPISQQSCFLSWQSWPGWTRNLSFKIKMLTLHHIILLNQDLNLAFGLFSGLFRLLKQQRCWSQVIYLSTQENQGHLHKMREKTMSEILGKHWIVSYSLVHQYQRVENYSNLDSQNQGPRLQSCYDMNVCVPKFIIGTYHIFPCIMHTTFLCTLCM